MMSIQTASLSARVLGQSRRGLINTPTRPIIRRGRQGQRSPEDPYSHATRKVTAALGRVVPPFQRLSSSLSLTRLPLSTNWPTSTTNGAIPAKLRGPRLGLLSRTTQRYCLCQLCFVVSHTRRANLGLTPILAPATGDYRVRGPSAHAGDSARRPSFSSGDTEGFGDHASSNDSPDPMCRSRAGRQPFSGRDLGRFGVRRA